MLVQVPEAGSGERFRKKVLEGSDRWWCRFRSSGRFPKVGGLQVPRQVPESSGLEHSRKFRSVGGSGGFRTGSGGVLLAYVLLLLGIPPKLISGS